MGATLVQNTREAFSVRFMGNGNTDYTLAISATLKVRRDATPTTEDWVMTIDGSKTTTTLVVASFAPTASGVGSVTTSGEVLHMRPILGFAGGAAYDIQLEPEIVVTVIPEVSGG